MAQADADLETFFAVFQFDAPLNPVEQGRIEHAVRLVEDEMLNPVEVDTRS